MQSAAPTAWFWPWLVVYMAQVTSHSRALSSLRPQESQRWAHSIPSLLSLKGHIHLQGKGSLTFSKVQLCFAVTESCYVSDAFTAAAQNRYILFLSQQLLEEMPLQAAFSGSSQFLPSPWPQDKANAQFY